MSTTNAINFLEAAWHDAALQERVQAQTNVAGIMALAAAEGFSFDEAQFYAAQSEIVTRYGSDGALSEDALEAASGGIGLNCGQNCHDCHHSEAP